MDAIVIIETLNGIIAGTKVFVYTDDTKVKIVREAEDIFENCITMNMPWDSEVLAEAKLKGYASDDSGYEITMQYVKALS